MSGRESRLFPEGENLRSDLNELCNRVIQDNEKDWQVIRKWFSRHTQSEAEEAASYRGKDQTTALHIACRGFVPFDVVQMLVNACTRALDWEDDFGWLPLHYACHHGVREEVLQLILVKNPDAVKVTDTKGRNPLHFAVGKMGKLQGHFASTVFTALTQTGAAKVADKKGDGKCLCGSLHYVRG